LCKDLVEAITKGIRLHPKFGRIVSFCYKPKCAKTRRYVTPTLLHSMLKYFHDNPMSGYLGAFKTCKVGHYCYWPKLGDDVFHYVRQCELCQRAKPAQNTSMGLHTATPTSCPMEPLWDPRCVPKDEIRLFGSNGQLFKVHGIFSCTEHNLTRWYVRFRKADTLRITECQTPLCRTMPVF